ncbi:hypothetical protein BU17DRAFT_97243 [Hysterangium stoloniferum]|nr:hypothetical protein BU17DRAFT_97243 [Hysterangium stoloniferum]
MSKPFGNRPSCIAHFPHALHVHIKEIICRELKQRHAVVIGGACIALIHIALVFTLLGAIVYLAHSRLQKRTSRTPTRLIRHWLWMTGTSRRRGGHAPAVDDGNIGGIDVADHPPTVDGGHVVGTDAADHAPAVDDGNIKGTNAADRPPVVDDGSLGGTDTDPDSTPRISWEDKGKGVDLREYGPLMLGGSLLTDHSTSALCKDPTMRRSIPTSVPKQIPPSTPSHKLLVMMDLTIQYRVRVEFSFMDDDDEVTDQKVLAGTSTQTDLSPAFAILADIHVTPFLPVVPFVHHIVSCQLNPRHASATTTAMDSEWINNNGSGKEVYAETSYRGTWGGSSSSTQYVTPLVLSYILALTRRYWARPDPVPRPKSSPPDFPEFKYQEIPPPKVTPSTRSPTDGHPRRPYRDEAESDGSSASMPNPKNQHQYEGHGDGLHVSKSPSSGTGTSSGCRRTKKRRSAES